ncbi:ovalbumin-related protein X-like [Penaeus japonicus]|uniref:ovalbumin-related protein X-like n=1 Tax=Penaeus japonicus TaxID=27405 RepID=UPI001C70DB7A|nr:ovalbumin-related protein X-like [Penaeus japonicus]
MAPMSTAKFLLVALTVLLAGEGDAHISQCFKRALPSQPDPEFSKGVAQFSFQFFKRLAESAKEENLFVSPYSVWSSLCLAYLGSGGNTRRELAHVLRLSSKTSAYVNWRSLEEELRGNTGPQAKVDFITTNKGYFSDSLQLDTCLQKSLPELEVLDFSRPAQTASYVNGVVSETTQGKIKDFLDARLLRQAKFILLNAVFFKGKWEYQFNTSDTTSMPFRVSPGKEVDPIPMMQQSGEFRYATNTPLNATVLELPYANSSYSMFLLQPISEAEGIQAVIKSLSRKNLEATIGQFHATTIRVVVPKFDLNTEIQEQFKATLQAMGIRELFTPAADLTGFSASRSLFVREAVHKATVEVTEEGTVAAAATALVGIRVAHSRPFVLDRPFVFLIMHRAMTLPVMVGVFNKPPAS